MRNTPPRFVFFDLGAVLMAFDHDRMRRQMAAVAEAPERLVTEALWPRGDRSDPQWLFEAGTLGPDEYYERFCSVVGARPDRAALELAASDIFEPIAASLAVAARLREEGVRIGILSNTNPWHWALLTDGRYPKLNALFEQRVTSFALKALKPDAPIYHRALAVAGVAPSETVFIDDREENVAGARAVGIDAFLFHSPEQMEAELRARGLPL